MVELEAWCMTGGTQACFLVRASCDLWRLLKWAAEAPGVITRRFPMSRFGEAVCVMRSGRAARWWQTDAAEAPLQHRMTDEDRREKGEWRLAHQHTDLAKAMLDILKCQKANA